jgi:hypothetical protein
MASTVCGVTWPSGGNEQVQTSGDLVPLATWWACVDAALDYSALAGALEVEEPGLDATSTVADPPTASCEPDLQLDLTCGIVTPRSYPPQRTRVVLNSGIDVHEP